MKDYLPYTTRRRREPASTGKMQVRHERAVRLTRKSRASRFPALRSKGSFRGALVAFGHSIVFESRLELMAAYLILNLPGIVDLIDQNPIVGYFAPDGTWHTHTFDFLAVFKDGKRVAVAVKPYGSALRHNLKVTLGWIRTQIGDAADEVALITDRSFSRAEAQNAEMLHFMRRTRDDEADAIVMNIISTLTGDTTIGALTESSGLGGRGFRAACRHLARHRLILKSQGRIGDDSIVSKGVFE